MDRDTWVPMGKLRVGERLSLADGSFATVASINFEPSPRATGRWKQGQACTGTFGTKADPETGLFVVYNLIVADWHTYFAGQPGTQAFVHNGGACVEVGPYGEMVERKGIGQQTHHLNQDASFGAVIPHKQGMSINVTGGIHDVGTQHYNIHATLERFWAQFRKGGDRELDAPTVHEYNAANWKALRAAGFDLEQTRGIMRQAVRQQYQHGLFPCDTVPAVPGPTRQRKG